MRCSTISRRRAEVKIPKQAERRERELRNLFRHRRKPFVDEAHNLHPKTLTRLKRLMEVIADGGGRVSVVLAGHPKLRNDLRRPTMEEIGYPGVVATRGARSLAASSQG
jgi:type II secretory pathway predicted ATPase ExeA